MSQYMKRYLPVLLMAALAAPLGLPGREPVPVPPSPPATTEPPFLGVTLQDMVISQVWDNSTAKAMGIRVGDQLVAWCSNPKAAKPAWTALATLDDLRNQLGSHKVGQFVQLKIKRNGKEMIVSGKLKPRPDVRPATRRKLRGLKGQPMVDWEVTDWFQADKENPPKLADYKGKVLIIACFQHWCPGSRSHLLPMMSAAEKALAGNDDVAIVYLQTVFEGPRANTFDKGCQDIRDHGLKGPFGQTRMKDGRSLFLDAAKANGTPWLIIVGRDGKVAFNNYRFRGATPVEAARKLAAHATKLAVASEDD